MSSFGERKIAPVSLHNLGKGSCYLGCETRRTGPHRPPRWPKWTVSGMQMGHASAVDIPVIEACKLGDALSIQDPDMALTELQKLAFTQFSQHAIDVDRRQP